MRSVTRPLDALDNDFKAMIILANAFLGCLPYKYSPLIYYRVSLIPIVLSHEPAHVNIPQLAKSTDPI